MSESLFEKFLVLIGKTIGIIIISAVVILSVVRIEGPGADAWFAKHPVVHVAYRVLSFFGNVAGCAR